MPILFDGSQVNFLIAFLAGTITFFASCLLPLVPAYLSYLTGVSISANPSKKRLFRSDTFTTAVFFVLGFISVFMLLGITASSLGHLFVQYKGLLSQVGGIFILFMGLFMLNLIQLPFLYQERKIQIQRYLTPSRKLNAFLIGLTFGFAWTPCIGPVLAVILFWASQTETASKGLLLLLSYGIGLGIPFLVIGLLFEKLSPHLKRASRVGYLLNKAAGIILIAVGVLLLMKRLETVSMLFSQKLNLNVLSL